jgi:signal transduction histidine kinase
MIQRYLLIAALLLVAVLLGSGCTTTPGPADTGVPDAISLPEEITTTSELVGFVADAAAFARENGREKAIDAFNDPDGAFVIGSVQVFAIDYDGTLLADAGEPGIVGTNILEMTDSFGVPLVQNLAETARFGRGFVSYTYPNPAKDNAYEPRIAVVEDVDGTYYVGAGIFASEGEIYPSVKMDTSGPQPEVDDLIAYVKDAVAYGRSNGKEKAISAFNDPEGGFVQGELVVMAFDYNGTNLAAPPYAPELVLYRINLINYQDPDGVDTIRGLRDLARNGGGFLYTVAKVNANGKDVYVPKIDYVEPVDDEWWIFSAIIVPEYAWISTGDLAAFQVRNHTREELYDRVCRAVDYAKANGKEKALEEINDPYGEFVTGDLFVWAESSEGVLLADPYLKSGIGENQWEYTDRYGVKVTQVGVQAMENGTGFSHALFPNTAVNGTIDVHKLIYMKPVDDTWWIGSGIYGIEVL